MPYKNKHRQILAVRGNLRTMRHGNWRQTYIDCAGMCVARVGEFPCGNLEQLELHHQWGVNRTSQLRFPQHFLICNYHHSIIDDRVHPTSLIEMQFHMSRLQQDVQLEIILAGSCKNWIARYKLDDSRFGCLLFAGPEVKEDYEGIC